MIAFVGYTIDETLKRLSEKDSLLFLFDIHVTICINRQINELFNLSSG